MRRSKHRTERRLRAALGLLAALVLGCERAPEHDAEPLCAAEHRLGKARVDAFLACFSGWKGDAPPRDDFAGDPGEPRLSGPLIDHRGYTLHQRVRVYYSGDVVRWLKERASARAAEREVAPLAEGAEIVKAMYVDDPSHPERDRLDGIVYMKRTAKGSRDGWFWGIWFRQGSPTFAEGFLGFAGAQEGFTFCLSCHASADDGQQTFAHLGNLTGEEVVSYTHIEREIPFPKPKQELALGPHGSLAIAADVIASARDARPDGALANAPRHLPIRIEVGLFGPDPEGAIVPGLLLNDYVVPRAGAEASPHASSDACQYCHDAALLQNGRVPEMMKIDADAAGLLTGKQFNLSPFGEWSASGMAMAARDPVFLAQLEAETERHAGDAERIEDFCLGCHAPLGQRELKLREGKERPLRLAMLYDRVEDAHGVVASLARDGVSCVACHRMSPEGLGTPATFNAQFALDPAPVIYGPFSEPKPHAMEAAIGLSPREGAHLRESGMCGSCHVVMPRVLGEGKPWEQARNAHEQTTYIEWRNSRFGKSARAEDTCQGCHLPDEFRSPEAPAAAEPEKLSFRIANIQGPGFPYQPNQAPDAALALAPRSYRRHTLTGINLVTSELFCQSSALRYKLKDPGIPLGNPFSRVKLASIEALRLGRERTARLEVAPPRFEAGALVAEVTVRNLAGHKLPTGVHFRRAFLDFRVLRGSELLWRSGATNAQGELVDASGRVLPSESATTAGGLEPDRREIRAPEEVQIYEERYVDPAGALTTSFLSLAKKVKDNRILPAGWDPASPDVAEYEMEPTGVADPQPELDRVTFRVPAEFAKGATHVELRLVYQALPPYFLRERTKGPGNESRKLAALFATTDFGGLATEGARLDLAVAVAKLAGRPLPTVPPLASEVCK